MKCILLVALTVILASCAGLQTREEGSLKTYQKDSKDVRAVRTENANLRAQISDYEEKFRVLNGKIEELEIVNSRLEEAQKKIIGEESQELIAYKDSVAELVEEKRKLEQQLALAKEEKKQIKQEVKNAKKSAVDHLERADALFDDKKWTEAVSEYQNFREKAKNKNTEDYAMATYKIGVCFQELGMVSEAKTFYQSVVNKHKKFKAAEYASYRLSQLK